MRFPGRHVLVSIAVALLAVGGEPRRSRGERTGGISRCSSRRFPTATPLYGNMPRKHSEKWVRRRNRRFSR